MKAQKNIKVMTLSEYAEKVYSGYGRSQNGSAQRIGQMIQEGKELPQVVKIDRFGKNGRYYLLHVEVDE